MDRIAGGEGMSGVNAYANAVRAKCCNKFSDLRHGSTNDSALASGILQDNERWSVGPLASLVDSFYNALEALADVLASGAAQMNYYSSGMPAVCHLQLFGQHFHAFCPKLLVPGSEIE